MEKFFTANKWFVGFCAVFLIVVGALQFVGNYRLAAIAKIDGQRIIDWSWPARNMRSKAEVISAEVLKRSDTDAVVKIKAKQRLQERSTETAPFKDLGQVSD